MRAEKIFASCILTRPPPRVLVVEDNEPIRAFLITVLELQGLTVDATHNGQEAIHRLRANEYDVVLLDLMPPWAGTEVMAFMERTHPEMLRDRFILVTAALGQKFREIQSRPVYCVLRKPFDVSELRSVVNDCLEATTLAARESGSAVRIELRPRPDLRGFAVAPGKKPELP